MTVGSAIERTMTIPGVVVPAFIGNHGHHLVDLAVYADGLVDAWGMFDLAGFRKALDRGWVETSVPDGDSVQVSGLGQWTVDEGRWELDADALCARVEAAVATLNPGRHNLYSRAHAVPGVTLGGSQAVPTRPAAQASSTPFFGDTLPLLVREDGALWCASLRVFEDGWVEVARVPTPRRLDWDGLAELVARDQVVSKPAAGARLHVHGVGSFTVAGVHWGVERDALMREAQDVLDRLQGRPDSIERCHASFRAFVAQPTEAAREALVLAYAAVPEHHLRRVDGMELEGVCIDAVLADGSDTDVSV